MSVLASGFWSLVAGSLVTGRWVAGHWSLVPGRWSLATGL